MNSNPNTPVAGLVERLRGHTPGPWRMGADLCRVHLNWRDETGGISPDCFHRNGFPKTIATVSKESSDWRPIEQAVADANLIAEAPNLLSHIEQLEADKRALVEDLREIETESGFIGQSSDVYAAEKGLRIQRIVREALATISNPTSVKGL